MASEGRDKVNKANKLLQPSVFALRMKPDWDQATPLFEEAARAFQRSGAAHLAEAQAAYEKAAVGQEKLGSELHAVKHYESAAECALRDGRAGDAAELYRTAHATFAGIGKVAMGAAALARGARRMEDDAAGGEAGDARALELYGLALEALEDDGGADSSGAGTFLVASQEIFASVTKILIRGGKYEDAARNELRYATFVDGLRGCESGRALARAYLHAVVLNLAGGAGAEAVAVLRDCCAVEAFTNSKAAGLAHDLIDTIAAGDRGAFDDLVKTSGILLEVDNAVARLLKKLTQAKFDQVAESIGNRAGAFGSQGGSFADNEDEDDLT